MGLVDKQLVCQLQLPVVPIAIAELTLLVLPIHAIIQEPVRRLVHLPLLHLFVVLMRVVMMAMLARLTLAIMRELVHRTVLTELYR